MTRKEAEGHIVNGDFEPIFDKIESGAEAERCVAGIRRWFSEQRPMEDLIGILSLTRAEGLARVVREKEART